VNEESPLESSLDLTLMQHPCDEDPEPWEVHAQLEVEPPRAWYYHISKIWQHWEKIFHPSFFFNKHEENELNP
jgi:hypothetical protein